MHAAQEMYKLLEENNELFRQGNDELEVAMEENMRASEAVAISEKEAVSAVSAHSPKEQPQPVISPTGVVKVEEKGSDTSALRMVREALLAAETNSKGLQAKLQMILNAGESSIESIFAKQELSFTILEQLDINGCVQCMLKVVGPNGEANVFGGTGQTKEASRDCAARAAFVYLETFLEAAMKSQQQ
uniref:DRBM domain-containing protein n=1 Tax=Parascaris equorum TaxID=6256 RepID=A0A914R8L0_PAREQ